MGLHIIHVYVSVVGHLHSPYVIVPPVRSLFISFRWEYLTDSVVSRQTHSNVFVWDFDAWIREEEIVWLHKQKASHLKANSSEKTSQQTFYPFLHDWYECQLWMHGVHRKNFYAEVPGAKRCVLRSGAHVNLQVPTEILAKGSLTENLGKRWNSSFNRVPHILQNQCEFLWLTRQIMLHRVVHNTD